ncbi:MAG: hypothetical protein KAT39_08780, partial [Alphaproteobacteria bacterium]|nr:hypothetical protein [Alphaproteobacteria bacterium]
FFPYLGIPGSDEFHCSTETAKSLCADPLHTGTRGDGPGHPFPITANALLELGHNYKKLFNFCKFFFGISLKNYLSTYQIIKRVA